MFEAERLQETVAGLEAIVARCSFALNTPKIRNRFGGLEALSLQGIRSKKPRTANQDLISLKNLQET